MSFKKYRDLILGVAALAFSGFYLYNATQIKTRPKLTPSYASAQIVPITLGILLALMAVLCDAPPPQPVSMASDSAAAAKRAKPFFFMGIAPFSA